MLVTPHVRVDYFFKVIVFKIPIEIEFLFQGTGRILGVQYLYLRLIRC